MSASDTTLTFSGALAATRNIFTNDDIAGNFQLNQLNLNYSGPATGAAPALTISGNPLEFVNDGATGPTMVFATGGTIKPTVTISNNLVLTNGLTLTATTSATLSGAISGASGLTMGSGSGTIFLNNITSTYTGVTTLNSGILQISGLGAVNTASSLGKGSAVLNAGDLVFGGGTLQYKGTTATTTDRLFTIGDATGNSATLDASGTTAGSFSWTNTGAIAFGTAGVHTMNFAGSFAGNATVFSTFAPLISDQNVVTGMTSVTKSGASAWTLTGANTYSGGTTISGGILKSTVSEGFGTGLITITSGQAFAAGTTYSNNWNLAGTIQLGNTTISGNITLSGDSVFTDGSGTDSTISGKITGNFGVTFVRPGSNNLTFIRLTNPLNDYTGDTQITRSSSSGRTQYLSLDASEVIPNGAGKGNLFMATTGEAGSIYLQLNGNNETINGLSSNNPRSAGSANNQVIQNGAATPSTLTVGDNNATATFIGLIQNGSTGVLNLTKKGSGTQTLSGNSTYTGATNITGGTLKIDYTLFGTSQTSAPTNYFSSVSDVTMGNGTTFAIQGRGDGGAISQTGVAIAQNSHFVTLPNAVASQLVVGQLLTLTKTGGGGTLVGSTYITAIDAPGATDTLVYGTGRLNSVASSTITVDTSVTDGTTSQTLKGLTLSGLSGENSTIDFGTSGDVVLTFSSAPVQVNDGSTLTIANWSGIADAGNGTERLMVTGNNTVRLAFLSTFSPGELVFTGFAGYDAVENTGGTAFEVFATTTVPEPTSLSVLLLGGAFMLKRRRRSKASIEVGIPTA